MVKARVKAVLKMSIELPPRLQPAEDHSSLATSQYRHEGPEMMVETIILI